MDDEQVATRSRHEIRQEMDDAEKKFQSHIMKRNEFNDKARQSREERDALQQRRKQIMDEVAALRDEKNAALEKLREHKEQRDRLHGMARKVIDMKKEKRGDGRGSSVSDELFSLKAQLEKMEYDQQTRPLSLDDERKMLDELRIGTQRLRALQDEYSQIVGKRDEVKSLDGEIDSLFKQADDEHQLVVQYYTKVKEYQDKVDEIYREVSHLIAEADKKHAGFIEYRRKADECHQKAMEMREHLTGIRSENRELVIQARQVITDQNRYARESITDPDQLDRKRDEALDALLKKGKISL